MAAAVARIARHTDLPIVVGFGITSAAQAETIASAADAAVVGSAIVRKVEERLDENGDARPGTATAAATRRGLIAYLGQLTGPAGSAPGPAPAAALVAPAAGVR